jgi:aerobic-type carbon monoxide dehydrogenase small subunit (CoxS/CutS family)
MALFKRLAETQRPTLAFTLDGQPATGLLGAGQYGGQQGVAEHLRGSDFSAERRAGFCLMGACQDCWVRLEDGRRVRACSTLLEDGQAIRRDPGRQA